MQTLIDIPEEDLTLLDKLSEARHVSRAEVFRTALSAYLEGYRNLLMSKAERDGGMNEAFGAWADFPEDGLAYQERIRAEWER